MSTIIYPSPIFGPVNSRRLGVSLGINLMPSDGKVCSFDCVYCECGFNADFRPKKKRPTREEVREGLEKVLKERHDNNQPLDDITFAGNGEPTGHPDFKGIVEDTMELCKKYFPEAQVSVLSNATYIYKEEVREALMLVDNNILKLDTVDMDYIKKLDRPQQPNYDVKDVIKYLKMFKGHVIIQTMFLRGDGLDNTSEHFVAPWLEAVKDIQPQQVMVYTIARETPDKLLEKAPKEVLDAIKPRYSTSYFNHVWDGGYAAGYYSYLWTEVLAVNIADYFAKHGALDPAVGQSFRDKILSRGNTKDQMEMFTDFTGMKQPDASGFLKAKGL